MLGLTSSASVLSIPSSILYLLPKCSLHTKTNTQSWNSPTCIFYDVDHTISYFLPLLSERKTLPAIMSTSDLYWIPLCWTVLLTKLKHAHFSWMMAVLSGIWGWKRFVMGGVGCCGIRGNQLWQRNQGRKCRSSVLIATGESLIQAYSILDPVYSHLLLSTIALGIIISFVWRSITDEF